MSSNYPGNVLLLIQTKMIDAALFVSAPVCNDSRYGHWMMRAKTQDFQAGERSSLPRENTRLSTPDFVFFGNVLIQTTIFFLILTSHFCA